MNTASVAFMITEAMKVQLRARGFRSAQIKEMTPAQAHAHLAPTDNEVAASSIKSLADLADEKRWVAWVEEIRKDELTKIPKNPATGHNARVPTDPKTYGTRAAAEQRWQKMQKTATKGGIGVVLGELPNGLHLVGIDLDSCLHAHLEDWAEEVVERFDTYMEISPSGKGVKLYFLMTAADMNRLHDLIGPNTEGEPLTRKTFAASKHHEVAIDIARFYAVTGQSFDLNATSKQASIRLVPFADVAWIINEVGPRYLAEQKQIKSRPLDNKDRSILGKSPIKRRKANGHDDDDDLDRSGSGYGVFEQLEALGWITRTPGPRQALHWIVNSNVHVCFAERAKKEAARRAATRELIINQIRGAAHAS